MVVTAVLLCEEMGHGNAQTQEESTVLSALAAFAVRLSDGICIPRLNADIYRDGCVMILRDGGSVW